MSDVTLFGEQDKAGKNMMRNLNVLEKNFHNRKNGSLLPEVFNKNKIIRKMINKAYGRVKQAKNSISIESINNNVETIFINDYLNAASAAESNQALTRIKKK